MTEPVAGPFRSEMWLASTTRRATRAVTNAYCLRPVGEMRNLGKSNVPPTRGDS